MRKFGFILLALGWMLTSCGEYQKVLKSTDYDFKYNYALKCMNQKQWGKAATLLEELVPIYKGTEKAEESLYNLARCYFLNKDYISAGPYFTAYYTTYPKGQYTEQSRYYCGVGCFRDSPEAKLDQTDTYKAINELQMFLEYFPKSEYAPEAQKMIADLQEKLAYKEYLSAKLYFDLGNYTGNNYQSAIITAQNTLRDYPFTQLREDLYFLILRSKNEEARMSVIEKKKDRYRDVIDEYFAFKNEFPTGKFLKQADDIYEKANKIVKE